MKSIEILGNRSFDDRVLKKRMRTKEARFYNVFGGPRYRRDMLDRDIRALESFYKANGFFEARITVVSVSPSSNSKSVRIRLAVEEGAQTLVSKVTFAGQDVVPERELRKGLRLIAGTAYNPNLLESDRYTLFSKYFERGYLGSKIAYSVEVDSLEASIAWEISPGMPVYIRDIRTVGALTVARRLITRELTFDKSELFDARKVLDSKQNLYDTGYFSSVEIEPDSLDLRTRRVDLVVRVRERKMGYIETGFGVGNVYGSRIFAEWGERNILGRGYALSIKGQYSFQLFPNNEYSLSNLDFRSKYLRYDGQLQFPRVLSTANTFAIGAFYERDATVEPNIVVDQGFALTLSRRFTRKVFGLLRYSLEDIEREMGEIEKSRSQRRAVSASFTRDMRDFYFNPRHGSYLSIDARYAGGALGGENNDYSLVGSGHLYGKAFSRTVIATRLRVGYAEAFGASREAGLPVESRYFAGGGNSVRGYKENSLGPVNERGDPLGGGIQILTNVELRSDLPYFGRWNISGALFIDGGNVWSRAGDIEFGTLGITDRASRNEYMISAGGGLRYNTPFGPIRFDVGFPLKRTADMDYDYRFHISLGQIF